LKRQSDTKLKSKFNLPQKTQKKKEMKQENTQALPRLQQKNGKKQKQRREAHSKS
jgi:hypothetical protein